MHIIYGDMKEMKCGKDSLGKVKSNKNILNHILPALILAVCSLCLLKRSFYSFSWSDESFYLTVVHRFWLGERMIVDEWFFTQVWGPLLLPFYALYRFTTGGNEGIYFYFRLLYWIISTLTAWCTYYKLQKRHSPMAGLVCALIYYLYARANIGGMSYYNMTLTWTLAATLIIYEQVYAEKFSKKKLYFVGIFLAFAVVSTPYLAVPYIAINAYLLIRKKYHCIRHGIFSVIAGTFSVAVVYAGYILYKSPLHEIIQSIPHILNEPEMQHAKDINFLLTPAVILIRIAWRYKWTIGIWTVLMAYIWYKKRKNALFTGTETAVLTGINLVVFIGNSFLSNNMLGCINIAVVLFAVPVIGIFQDSLSLDRRVLGVFGTAGGSLVLAFSFSSDTGLDAMAIGFVLAGMTAVLLLFELDVLQKEKVIFGMIVFACSVMIFQTAMLRFFSVYRDAPISQLNRQLTSGVGKYLFTTKEHAEQYDNIRAAIEEYVREDDQVLYTQNCFWGYLCTDNAYGTPSSWRMPFNSPRLEEYYTAKPEKIPTCIFVLNPAYGDFESSLIQGNEKEEFPNENKMEGYLADYIRRNDYEKIELECATIFRSRSG